MAMNSILFKPANVCKQWIWYSIDSYVRKQTTKKEGLFCHRGRFVALHSIFPLSGNPTTSASSSSTKSIVNQEDYARTIDMSRTQHLSISEDPKRGRHWEDTTHPLLVSRQRTCRHLREQPAEREGCMIVCVVSREWGRLEIKVDLPCEYFADLAVVEAVSSKSC